MGRSLRAPRGTDRRAPQHADFRQYAQACRACHPPAHGAAGRRYGLVASRQPVAPQPAAHGTTAQGGKAQGRGGHRVARAGHRHRPHRPGLSIGDATLDCHVPAARRPCRPFPGPGAERPALRPQPGRADRMPGSHPGRARRAAGSRAHAAGAAGRAGPAARGHGRHRGLGRGCPLRALPPRLSLSGLDARRL